MTLTANPAGECSVCHEPFVKFTSTQVVCSVKCARRVPVIERKKDADRREALKTKKEWMKEAQAAFNLYVRLRDVGAGHGCIDCGKPFEPERFGGSLDAGHYLSRGSAPHLKFDERNVFAQRKNCNRPGGATRADFRAGVIARIGLEAVEALESDQSVKQYRSEDLKAIRDEYRAKARALKKAAK